MEREGLSEQDAFARLRKASQISGRPLKVVAEALIATLDVKHVGAGGHACERGVPRPYGAESSRSSCGRRSPRRTSQASEDEQGERPDDNQRVEHDHRFEREISTARSTRVSKRDGDRHDGRRLRRLSPSWIVAKRASAVTWARAPRTCASSLRAASRRASSVARVSASSSVAASLADSRAIRSRKAVSRFASSSTCPWRSSICTCCDDDLAEPREPHDRVLHIRRRHLERQRRRAGFGRRIRRGHEVAAQIARDPERLLGASESASTSFTDSVSCAE